MRWVWLTVHSVFIIQTYGGNGKVKNYIWTVKKPVKKLLNRFLHANSFHEAKEVLDWLQSKCYNPVFDS